MSKPIIGILGEGEKTYSDKSSFAVIEYYKNAIIDCGGIPIMLMTTQSGLIAEMNVQEAPKLSVEEYQDMKEQLDRCDGVLLPGGNRIYPYDLDVSRRCLEEDKPILGICLGMQNLACVDTHRNIRDLVEHTPTEDTTEFRAIKHNSIGLKYVHTIDIKKGTRLHDIIDRDSIKVNSRHIHRIKENILKNAIVSATAPDGTIEAIEFPFKKFAIGVQFHPELLYKDDEVMKKIFRTFIIESAINNF